MNMAIYSKYITYANIVLSDKDIESNIDILKKIYDGEINVIYPLSVEYSGRRFKIQNRDFLNIFLNAVQCTFDIVCDEGLYDICYDNDSDSSSIDENKDLDYGKCYYGVSPNDELPINWSSDF